MNAAEPANPFFLLQLPVTTLTEDITERSREMTETLDGVEKVRLLQATDELVLIPRNRLRHELFEVPDTHYRDAAWENFINDFDRLKNVLDPIEPGGAPPRLADFNWVALMRLVIEEQIRQPSGKLLLAIEQPPFKPGCGPSPLEVQDVIFG